MRTYSDTDKVPEDIQKDIEKACLLHERAVSDYAQCQEFSKLMSDTKEVYIPFTLYITGANNLKYVVKNRLFCEVSKDQVKIHSQTTAIERTEWKTNKL